MSQQSLKVVDELYKFVSDLDYYMNVRAAMLPAPGSHGYRLVTVGDHTFLFGLNPFRYLGRSSQVDTCDLNTSN